MMAELAYSAVANAGNTHTITRSTGASVLTGQALFTYRGTQYQTLMAFRALRFMVNRDAMSASDPADYPTTGSRTL